MNDEHTDASNGLLEPGETAECRDDSAGDERNEHTDASNGRLKPRETAECREDSAGDERNEHTDAKEHRLNGKGRSAYRSTTKQRRMRRGIRDC